MLFWRMTELWLSYDEKWHEHFVRKNFNELRFKIIADVNNNNVWMCGLNAAPTSSEYKYIKD